MLAERPATFIFLGSIIPYTFMLRLIIGSVQIAHSSSHYLALTSNLSVEIDWQNFTLLNDDDDRSKLVNKNKNDAVYLQFEDDTADLCHSVTQTKKAKNRKFVIDFQCSCFVRAGNYNVVIKSLTNESNKSVIKTVHVLWPLVNLTIPESYTALSNDGVTVNFRHKLGCAPPNSLINHTSALEIWYAQLDNAEKSFKKLGFVPIQNWWTVKSLTISCERFDRAGAFKIILAYSTDSANAWNVIAESNEMIVRWYQTYRLKMPPGSIFPCPTSGVAVSFDRPSCVSSNDRIRLYGVIVNETAKSKYPVYIGEEKIVDSKSVVNFGCNYFDLIYLEYCFKYFTAADDGAVNEHAVQCVPTQQTNFMPVHGQWSEWKEWGPCTVTCDTGVQHRVRLCNSPKPKYYGRFCHGEGIETKSCDTAKCPNITMNYGDANRSVSFSSPCQCGCLLTKEETIVIDSFACKNLSLWPVEAPSNFVIHVRLISFHLADPSQEWLKIRQSLNDTGRLLFDSKQSSTLSIDDVIISGGNQLRVEYFGVVADETAKEKVIAKKGALWKGIIIKITFVGPIGETMTNRVKNVSYLLFVILAGSASAVVLLTLCVVGCLLFRNAKKKLLSKCRLIKSHSSGSIKEIDPLMEDMGSVDTSTAPITAPTSGRNDASLVMCGQTTEGHNGQQSQRTIRVTIESADEERYRQSMPFSKIASRATKTENGHNLPQIPEEIMTASTHTQSTRLSTVTQKSGELSPPPAIGTKTVRSIGIQLSSPALPLKRRFSFGSKMSVGTPSNMNNNNSHSNNNAYTNNNNNNNINKDDRCESPTNFSIAGTEQDFEYDYSEYAVPGSILNPDYRLGAETFLQSDISIDDIIAQCDLMKSPSPESSLEKSSVSTQIQNDSLEFSVLPKKSMTQFHYL